jgi:hypothetical protein
MDWRNMQYRKTITVTFPADTVEDDIDEVLSAVDFEVEKATDINDYEAVVAISEMWA